CCANNAAVANPCDSNTILKVKADRQCAEWLACTESEKTTDSKGNIIEMCKKRVACNKTGDGVECASDGLVPETKRNQTFDDPIAIDAPATHAGVVADANLRSGYFKAGAHWARVCDGNKSLSCQVDSDCGANGPCIDRPKMVCSLNPSKVCASNSNCLVGEGICGPYIEGYYPHGQMAQVGSLGVNPVIFEDDFETYQSGVVLPQCSVNATQAGTCVGDDPSTPADEDTCKPTTTKPANEGICLNYWSGLGLGRCSTTTTQSCRNNTECPQGPPAETCNNISIAKATNKEFKFGGQSLLVLEGNVAGNEIVSKDLLVSAGNYVLTAWINTKDLNPQTPSNNDPNLLRIEVSGAGAASIEQKELQDWTKYISDPFVVAAGNLKISIYMVAKGNVIKAGSKAYIDMISLAPVLE
ncbi:MAG: hypothetical protein AAB408_03605, partial [Patescibacteria group bacterium]